MNLKVWALIYCPDYAFKMYLDKYVHGRESKKRKPITMKKSKNQKGGQDPSVFLWYNKKTPVMVISPAVLFS